MKKLSFKFSSFIFRLSFFISAAVLLSSCGGGSKNAGPKTVADRFAKAFFADMDIDSSRRYVSAELLDEFPESDKMSELEKHFIKILTDHAKAYGYKFEYDAGNSEIGDSSADICYVLTARGNPDWKGTGEVELEKDADGRWIVTDYEFDHDESAIDFGF